VRLPLDELPDLCVDARRQWARAGNIRYNAALRSGLYALGVPLRALARSSAKGSGQ
jgi:hypothetical protein